MAPISPTGEPTHARRWVVVFAVALAIVQYIDRVAISQAAPFITKDLSLTKEQMSYIFSAFTLAYAVFEIPTGYWGDRIGAKRVLLRVVLWWSAFTAFTGMAWNFVSLWVIRFLFGAGEAGCFPNLANAFKRWLPKENRAQAKGILWMCARWGGAAGPVLFLYLQQLMHWRTTFYVFASLGVVWAVLFYLWYRDNPREHPGVNAAEAALLPAEEATAVQAPMPWGKLVRSRTAWCLCGQYAAIAYGWYFFVTWFPTYLLEELKFNMKASAWLGGSPLLLGGCGCFLAGWLTPALNRRWGASTTRRVLGATGLFGGAVLLLVSTYLTNPYLAVAAIALTSFANDLAMPGAWTACMEFAGRYAGTMGGAMNMMGNLGGFLSPIILAKVVSPGNWAPAFYITSAVAVVGGVCWLLVDTSTSLEEQVKD
jgi:ACS family glucarate transporter-like MFS transporter